MILFNVLSNCIIEKDQMEAERDQRTVFAFNLPLRADEDAIHEFFSQVGKVRDIRIITDRNSRKSKGYIFTSYLKVIFFRFGYIEYYDKDNVPSALQLSGKQIMGQTVQVQPTQAEKNRVVTTTTFTSTTTFGPTRLYVGSLHFNITEDDLKLVFAPFGDIEFINLHIDQETGRSKGFGFVQYVFIYRF
jgi:RNA-binding protein 39